MASRKIRPGDVFGRLTVVRVEPRRYKTSHWLCRCECGNTTVVLNGSLTWERTRSCGCLKTETSSARTWKHGLYGTSENQVWAGIIKRCTNPNSISYKRYGGRGITICERWREFANFIADVGPRPSLKHSIDRIDNDGNYEPGNVRWATRAEQSRNRSRNIRLTHNGESLVIADWAARLGVRWSTVKLRLEAGWSVAEAVTTPKYRHHSLSR